MRLVEHNELVKGAFRTFMVETFRVRDDLEKHDEEPESFVLLDELVAKVNDDEATWANLVFQANRVVDVFTGEFETKRGHALQVVRQRRGVNCLVQPVERQIVAQRLHNAIELPNVGGLIADGPHEETPVARLQFGCAELQGPDRDVRVLAHSIVQLVGRRKKEYVRETSWLRTKGLLQRADLGGLAVWR